MVGRVDGGSESVFVKKSSCIFRGKRSPEFPTGTENSNDGLAVVSCLQGNYLFELGKDNNVGASRLKIYY